MWYNLSDISYCFSSAFLEHHPGTGMNKLGILDESKATFGLIPSLQRWSLSIEMIEVVCLVLPQWTRRIKVIIY